MEDREIIELFYSRDELAIHETSLKYGRFCSNISRNILHNEWDVEECVSDTYLHAWNSIPPAQPHSFMAYLGKITRNISLNLLKFKQAEKRGAGRFELALDELSELITSSNSTDDIADRIALRDSINRWLDTLTHQQRMVFVGRYWYFDSIIEIAIKLGYSEGKTKMLLLRLRKSLKEHLESEGVHL